MSLCKAPVKSSPPTNQHPVVFTGRMPFLSPNQQCQSTEGKNITFHGLAYPKLTLGVFQLCLWPLIAPGHLGEGCHTSHQSSDASTPLPWVRVPLSRSAAAKSRMVWLSGTSLPAWSGILAVKTTLCVCMCSIDCPSSCCWCRYWWCRPRERSPKSSAGVRELPQTETKPWRETSFCRRNCERQKLRWKNSDKMYSAVTITSLTSVVDN